MRPLDAFPDDARNRMTAVLADIDDTLTTDGHLTATAYAAMERLHEAGLRVVPITGRPGGWCDHIARMWPVDAVVGENGAFYFRYDHETRAFTKRYLQTDAERADGRKRLDALRDMILAEVPGAGVSSDQAYRESDLAIDYCEDVPRLPDAEVQRIVNLFEAAGATAKVSSVHVNGWFGSYDKLAMTRLLFAEAFGSDLGDDKDRVVFVGDSPNDAPMFGFFPHAVGVANVGDFGGRLAHPPAYVTQARAGAGFAEVVDMLCRGRD